MPGLYAKPLANGQTVPVLLEDGDAQAMGLQPYLAPGGSPQAGPQQAPMPPPPAPPGAGLTQAQAMAKGGVSFMPPGAGVPPQAAAAPTPPVSSEDALRAAGQAAIAQGAANLGPGPAQPSIPDPLALRQARFNQQLNSPAGPAKPAIANGYETRSVKDLLGQQASQPQRQGGYYGGKPIPAHDQRVGYEVQRMAGVPEGDLAEMDKANANYDAASARVIDQQKNQNLTVANDLQIDNNRLEWELTKEQQKRADIDAEIGRRKYDIDRREAETEKLTDASPETFWKEKGIAGQFAAAIAYTLGGYLQGYQGRATNPGADLVNQTIEQWVHGQRDKYERSRGRVTDAQNAYKEALDRWGTPEAAEADMRMRANTLAVQQLQINGAKAGIPVAEAGGLESIAQRQAARAAARAQLEAQIAGSVAEKYAYIPMQYPQQGAAPPNKNLIMLRGQPVGYVRNETDFQPVQKGIDGMSVAVDELDNVKKYMQDANIGPSEKKARADSLAFRIARSLEQAEQQGVIREGEKDDIMKGLGSPGDWVNIYGQQRLQETQRYVEHKLQTVIGNHVVTGPKTSESATGPLVNAKAE